MHKLCLACLLNFAKQASCWAELERGEDLSDQNVKKGSFLKVEELSFRESAVKIRELVGTPNLVYLFPAPIKLRKKHIFQEWHFDYRPIVVCSSMMDYALVCRPASSTMCVDYI